MEISERKIVLTTIEASEGHKLTQVAEVPLIERVTSSKISSTAEINPDDWKEITEAEAAEIRELQKQLIEQHKKIAEE